MTGAGTATAAGRAPGAGAATTGARSGATRGANAGILWYQDKDGTVKSVRVRTGITDGQRTVVTGEGITAGMQIIVGAAQASGTGASATPTATSPFQAPTQGGGPRGPGGF
jgi:HlyD family secretion protein